MSRVRAFRNPSPPHTHTTPHSSLLRTGVGEGEGLVDLTELLGEDFAVLRRHDGGDGRAHHPHVVLLQVPRLPQLDACKDVCVLCV